MSEFIISTLPADADPLTADRVVVATLRPGDLLIGLPYGDRDSGPMRDQTLAAAHRVGASAVILPLPDREILSIRGGRGYVTLPASGGTYTVGLAPGTRAPEPEPCEVCERCGRVGAVRYDIGTYSWLECPPEPGCR